MYLEKIEIFGFKSFADKTTIHFSKPVTAIVGPNGCGKSNVVDAFRWVLGGPTAKSLRSDKMIDVIFSGTTKRKPLNYAQISLTFTQIDKALSVDFQEICITRRLYRTGESEWLLNKNPVRLKDVHKLLWEAGLGKNAFYIFEQGKIDDLIMSTPYERRNIFEEAAKIMHFKEKRKEAFRKLSQVEANLKRVLDIQLEVEKQIEALTKQAEEAENYKREKEELEVLEKKLVIAKWKHNDEKQSVISTTLSQKENEQQSIKGSISQVEASLKTLKEKHQQQAELAKQSYEAFFEVKKAKELASFEFNSHQKKLEDLSERSHKLKQTLQQFHQKHLQEHKLYLENQTQLQSHESKLEEFTQEHANSFSQLDELELEVQNQSAERKKQQTALMESVNSEKELQMQLSQTTTNLENIMERHKRMVLQQKESSSKKEKLTEQKVQLVKELEKTSDALIRLSQQKQELDQGLEQRQHDVEQQREQLRHLQEEVSSSSAKVKLLENLKDSMDGYGKSTKVLLKASQDSSHPLHQKVTPLSDWIVAKKEYEGCLASLLGSYLQTLVVKTKADLELLLQTAQKQSLGNFSILCLEHLSEGASSQSFANPNLVSNHFLDAISEVPSIDQLKPLSIVNKELFVDQKSVIHHLSSKENNIFSRENELRETSLKLIQLEKEKEKHSSLFEQAQIALKKHQEQMSIAQNELQQMQYQHKEVELNLSSTEKQLDDLSQNASQFEQHHQSLSDSLKKMTLSKEKLAQEFEKQKQSRVKLESHFNTIEAQFEENFQKLNEKRSLKQALESKIKNLEKESQTLTEKIKIFESKSADFEEQIQTMNQQIEELETRYQDLAAQNQEFVAKEKMLTEKLGVADKEYHAFEDALEQIESQDKELSASLKTKRDELEQIQSSDVQLNNQKSQLLAENNLYFGTIFENYGLDESQLHEFSIESDFAIGKSERDVKRLRRSLSGYTEINLKAVADCKEKQERFKFLQCQIEDLNTSKDKLVEVITELDNTSKTIFLDTFEKIRKHFKENYTLLFNGGEADLELNANEDVLEAGIEIIAQPPGKKMRSITQMSGGEKCLTALALLFALFETQSIPFCILDEVDAPLDDTNIERFTRVLRQFVKKHQFIIITHNKRTMAMADILLGISMQEKGVTKVIPFEFQDHENQEETPSNSEALVT